MEKYIKLSWPESQYFMSNVLCYNATCVDDDGLEFMPLVFVPESMYEQAVREGKMQPLSKF